MIQMVGFCFFISSLLVGALGRSQRRHSETQLRWGFAGTVQGISVRVTEEMPGT